jgi:hypothetical protein
MKKYENVILEFFVSIYTFLFYITLSKFACLQQIFYCCFLVLRDFRLTHTRICFSHMRKNAFLTK